MKRFLRIVRNIVLTLLALVLVLFGLLNLPAVQTFLAQQAAKILSKKLKTEVQIAGVNINFKNQAILKGVLVKDQQHDTLLWAGQLRVQASDWFYLNASQTPVLRYIGLQDAWVHLNRGEKSPKWNYQFIIDAFDTGPKDTTAKNTLELDLKKLELKRVRFWMDDAWAGTDNRIDVGALALDVQNIDLKKKEAFLDRLDIEGARFAVRDYPGGQPKDSAALVEAALNPYPLDSTAFNPDGWRLGLDILKLEDCAFVLDANNKEALPAEFDPAHMNIRKVQIDAKRIRIVGDTLTGSLNQLHAEDRSGFVLENLRAAVTVSPVLTELRNLELKTPNSFLGDYYAMHYSRFPDYTDYLNKVRMVANLKDTKVDTRDIAFFGPAIKELKQTVVTASGKFEGTVTNFQTQNLTVTDGESKLRGNLSMKGLPDIETTFIRFDKGQLFTTGPAILKWAPQLRNHPAVALEKLQYAYFDGNFAGYPTSAFAAAGTLRTNLGTVVSNMKLTLPARSGRNAIYKGTISTTAFQIGPLLRIPQVGAISMSGTIDGKGFDPLYAEVGLDLNISRLEAAGYPYQNILAKGVLARKKFSGTGQVTDPNLALAFDGFIDFSGERPVLVAKANLLSSDFKALGLVTDSLQASADIDIATIGVDPDIFTGTATLYNIDVRRNGARLDLDSIQVSAFFKEDNKRRIEVWSNALTGSVEGTFKLTEIPAVTQGFLTKYLPGYIAPPAKLSGEQSFEFGFETKKIDPLLAVLLPSVRGFDSSTFIGYIKSEQQQLVFEANVPQGIIGPLYLNQLQFLANGDYGSLLITGSAGRMATQNGLLNASLDFKSLVGNDSLDFTINTRSPDAYGTAFIKGDIHVSRDTVYASFRPSDFLLNGDRWQIAAGNEIVFAPNYLLIRNLSLSSGAQKLLVNTEEEGTAQVLTAKIDAYDLSTLGRLEALKAYEPEGRVSGTVQIKDMFKPAGFQIAADLRGAGLMLGIDTLGDALINGSYDGTTGKVVLNENSGIFRGDASLNAGGTFLTTGENAQALRGKVIFNKTPASWLEPLLRGSVSNLEGYLQGRINIGGTVSTPDTDGDITLHDVGMRVTVLGTSYKIPQAQISLSNRNINLGTITLADRAGGEATITGGITHRNFNDLRFNINIATKGLEMLNLRPYENDLYYGELTAAARVQVRGTTSDLSMSIMDAEPTKAGTLYLPVGGTSLSNSYSYVTFKNYDVKEAKAPESAMRFSLYMDVVANPLINVSMILDPSTGDAINAKGNGSVRIELPSGAAPRMYGNYNIESGDYTFTLRQVAFQRKFIINRGSSIAFGGPIDQTRLDVQASYPTTARLYDLLSQRQSETLPESELTDAKASQRVNLLLNMKGPLLEPALTFDIELPDQRSAGTVAEAELRRIKQNERELFDQVASLLVIGSFVPSQGIVSSTAGSTVLNNASDLLSSNVSGQLTNIVNKILGDDKIALDLKYKNYNLADAGTGGALGGRNEVKLGLRRNFFNDRLIIEVGSAYDWGRPVGNSNRSNFNPVGDFRLQYLLQEDGRVRLNLFRTSNYDVLVNDNISRSGAGVSFRRSFGSFGELFGRKPEIILPPPPPPVVVGPLVDTVKE